MVFICETAPRCRFLTHSPLGVPANTAPDAFARLRKLSAVRNERAMMVSAGLAGKALGKTELSHIQRLETSKLLPQGSTTPSAAS